MLKKLIFSHFIFLLIVLSVHGQEELLYLPVTADFKNIKLDSALNILEVKTDLYFTYDASKVDINRNINANFVFTPLSIVLDSIIQNPFLSYQLIDKQLIIYSDLGLQYKEIDTTKVEFEIPIQVLQAKIVDAETKNTLPFVNIGVQNKSIGTISNENGDFILKLRSGEVSDTLIFSYIGFKSQYIPAKDLIIKGKVIELEPNIIPLQEVVIRSTDPKGLVRYALQHKKDNYSSNPSLLRCFYREIMTRNNKYKLYTEGLLDVYKSAYRPTLFNDQIKLLKRRRFSNVVEEDTVQFKLQGGLKSSLDLDLVKHPLEFVQMRSLNQYNYQLSDIVSFEDRLLYQIEFSPANEGNELAFEGTIFIDVISMAIVKLQFNYTSKSLKKAKNAFVLRKSRSIKVSILSANYEVTYKEISGKYYINRIFGSLNLRVKKKNKFLASNFETSFELVITDVQTQNIDRFNRKEVVRPNKIFNEIISNYDSGFWNGDNFILPEKDLTKALGRFTVEELKINRN